MPVKRQITHQYMSDDRVTSVLIGSIKTDRDLAAFACGASPFVLANLQIIQEALHGKSH
jgi:hypothetical protein